MASGANVDEHTRDQSEVSESLLLDLLSNTLVLQQTIPYLPISSLLNLAATSKAFGELLYYTPGVFRHLDLTRVKVAQFDLGTIDHSGEIWRNVQVDENITEDDFYAGPLRGIFSSLRQRNLIDNVKTLILDGLSVTAELVNEILLSPDMNVRILSIREVKNMNERKLMAYLEYACRRTRPENRPKLKGLYVFGKRDTPALPSTSLAGSSAVVPAPSVGRANVGATWNHKSRQNPRMLKEALDSDEDGWYHRRGRIIDKPIVDGWADTLVHCREAICFDAVLCTGPRHQNSPAFGKVPISGGNGGHGHGPSVATFAVGACSSCGSAPEGFTIHGESPAEQLPLLAPIPLHSSNVKVASSPQAPITTETNSEKPKFVPRCWECIRERYCFSCDEWWCETCYQVPTNEELAQLVHIVDPATDGLLAHEIAAMEPPKIKVRLGRGYCPKCYPIYLKSYEIWKLIGEALERNDPSLLMR